MYDSESISTSGDGINGRVLIIDKENCKITDRRAQPGEERSGTQSRIAGVLGVMNIMGFNFMLAITEKEYVGKMDGAYVYAVTDVELFPFSGFNIQCKNYIDGMKKLLTSGFYFSYNADLTTNRQRAADLRQFGRTGSLKDTWDHRYIWNWNICQDFRY